MPDFFTAKKVDDIMASHAQAVAQMEYHAKELGNNGKRAVQLWTQAATLINDPEETAAAGTAFAAEAATRWAATLTDLTAGIDALAAGSGLTRAQILAAVSEAPVTQF